MPAPPVHLDECVHGELLDRLRRRGFQVTNAVIEGTFGYTDEQQLAYAARAGLILLTHNKRHFLRLHARWRRQGRSHAGIIILPQSSLLRREIRAALMLTWIDFTQVEPESMLWIWNDCQSWLIAGGRLPGFTESEVEFALGRRQHP
jgi:hypothetical protein